MKTLAALSIGMSLAAIGSVPSTAAAEVPTRWSLHNKAETPVIITCERAPGQDHTVIKLKSTLVAARSVKIHNWGDAYYADGMGLNPGTWHCSAGPAGKPLADAGSFVTDWGEHVALTISERKGRLTIAKRAATPAK